MDPTLKPSRLKTVKSVLLPDGFVALYDLERNLGSTLSPEAAIVWELCDGKHDISQLLEEVASMTGQSPDKEAIADLLTKLEADGFVSVS